MRYRMSFSQDELERYQRHFALENVGTEGQQRIKKGKVLVVGAGGLGSPILYYLGAAGVGTLGVVDGDLVDCSNLQRQILHNMERLGQEKALSAKQTIEQLNPNVKVNAYVEKITENNIEKIAAPYDIVVDAVDNFQTRFVLSDYCVKAGKPFVHGGVLAWGGQAMTYLPHQNQACYRCIYESVPTPDEVPDCKKNGLLCTVPGIIGSVEAMEVLRILVGQAPMYAGKLFTFDGKTGQTRVVKLPQKSSVCPVCSKTDS